MLLDDIIDLLSDEKASLSDALLKTKVLLHRMGKKELAHWVNNELDGYPRDSVLPAYRLLPSHVVGNVANPARRYQSFPLPIQHLKPEEREHLEHAHMFESLAVLEDMINRAKQGNVTCLIPLEYDGRLGEPLDNSYHVENAWCVVGVHDIKGIPAHIRSRLLDFMLELQDAVGAEAAVSELKEKSTSFDAQQMFNNAIFGPNTTILFGHHSTINSTQSITGAELAERVRELVDQVEKVLSTSGLPGSVREDAKGALAELREAAAANTPDVSRLRRGLESLRHVMEHAAGHVVATGVLALIGELLSHAAH